MKIKMHARDFFVSIVCDVPKTLELCTSILTLMVQGNSIFYVDGGRIDHKKYFDILLLRIFYDEENSQAIHIKIDDAVLNIFFLKTKNDLFEFVVAAERYEKKELWLKKIGYESQFYGGYDMQKYINYSLKMLKGLPMRSLKVGTFGGENEL